MIETYVCETCGCQFVDTHKEYNIMTKRNIDVDANCHKCIVDYMELEGDNDENYLPYYKSCEYAEEARLDNYYR